MRKPLARILPLAVALLSIALLPSTASAAAPSAWTKLADEIAGPWPGLQKQAGWFPDYVYGGGRGFCLKASCKTGWGNARYGESTLGYGLVMAGLRFRDERMLAAGIKAISYIVSQPDLQRKLPTAFEGMAVAASYNLLKEQRPNAPGFAEGKRTWEAFMRRQPVITTIFRKPETPRYGNHFVLEAIEVFELLRTGLSSSDPNAILGGKRASAKRIAETLINERVPQIARRGSIEVKGAQTWLHSDPPDNPLAYAGLAPAFYARAVELLGSRATTATRTPIERAANAAIWAMGPDGDSAYYGRSQQDAWAYPALALGMEAAASLPTVDATQREQYHGVTEHALARLRDAYGNGPQGWWITPGVKQNLIQGLRGVDHYAGSVAFAGLTLVPLMWALERMDAEAEREVGAIGADRDSAVSLSRGESRIGIVRDGDVWFAVKRQASTKRKGDLRYDAGLVALKVRDGGTWRDVLRQRPLTSERFDSVGPNLRMNGAVGVPRGGRMIVRGSSVVVGGGYRSAQRRWLRRGVDWTYTATACGVELTFPVRAGDRYDYSAFFRRSSEPVLRNRILSGDGQRITFSQTPSRVSVTGSYASGNDPDLVRARALLEPTRSGELSITTCAA